MKYFVSFLIVCLFVASMVQGQTPGQNYVLSRTWKQSGAAVNDISKVQIKVQYMDGLGRPLQNVSVGQSPSGADIVEHFGYDAAGRQSRIYLPYTVPSGNGIFQASAITAQNTFYTNNVPELKNDDLGRPFSESSYEASALNRSSSVRSPGNKSNPEARSFGVNSGTEVKRYVYSANADLTLTISSPGNYSAGTLLRTQTTDEQGNDIVEFSDMQDRLVCRKVEASVTETLDTYYVYDDYSLLRAVLQPQYQEGSDPAEVKASNFAFLYDYDVRGRIVKKKVPGAGIIQMVYDNADRMVLSQDANQLSRTTWFFTKYDAFNRPIATGEFYSTFTLSDWRTLIDQSPSLSEFKLNTGIHYTLNQTVPYTVIEESCFTITYYDDYSFPKPASLDYTASYYPSTMIYNNVKPTGQKTRINPERGASGPWLNSVTYYDSEYRPIQSSRELFELGSNAIERVSTKYKYNLATTIEEEKTEQVIGGSTISHLRTLTHDHMDRVLSIKEKITNAGNTKEITTVAQRYNALGVVKQKWLHSVNGKDFRRRTDFTDNIRGWRSSASTKYLKQLGFGDSTFYAYGLGYASGAAYTNGNISDMQWMLKGQTAFTKGLSFTYDNANRLKESGGLLGYIDTESGINYDKNGNIKTLNRSGAVTDILEYLYTGSGNRISSINNTGLGTTGVKSGLSTYVYDAMGNMTTDGNRGAVITYNHLNFPKSVILGGKTLTYNYDASGNKHKYVADTLAVKYAGAFEYRENASVNSLYRIAISEGQAVYRGGVMKFEYNLQDHLGNVRVVFDEAGKIIQSNDYYPFGLNINRNGLSQAAQNGTNRYLYNNKELQAGSGYLDYGARMYMPEIGRWGTIDPLTDSSRRFSSYAYTFDNPLRFIDPDGKMGDAPGSWLQNLLNYFGFFQQPASQQEGQTYSNRQERLSNLNSHMEQASDELRDAAGWVPFLGGIADISHGKVRGDNTTVAMGFTSVIVDAVPGGKTGAKTARGIWKLTDEGASMIKSHNTWGKFFKGADGLWWSEDITKHGASNFKVFKEGNKGLEWIHNADKFGDYIINQHKSPTGTFIPWGQLKTIK